jgi:outer membrane protein assembly factor BamB
VWGAEGDLRWTFDSSPSAEQQAHAPPELGYVPDYGYLASTVADFDGDGSLEVGWGTRCHYYVLKADGTVLWQAPLVVGHGAYVVRNADGTLFDVDEHGLGGPAGFAGGIGNLDDDAPLEVVLSSAAECRVDAAFGQRPQYSAIAGENTIRAWDGRTGLLQWEFRGAAATDGSLFAMYEPLLVDLDGDGRLDVLAMSSDGNIYGVKGQTGQALLTYRVAAPSRMLHPYGAPSPLCLFIPQAEQGLLLYTSPDDGRLNLVRIAARAGPLFLPLIEGEKRP